VFGKATQLRGCAVEATDGAIGSVVNSLFDDERWVVRYLVVDTGKWLPGRKVLVSPLNVRNLNWGGSAVQLSLTREQVKNSPDIDSDRPVSRQREIDFYRYYGYPHYWGGVGLWGTADTPDMLARADEARQVAEMRARDLERPDDVHLRDAAAVTGYHVQARDGEIGHVEDFVVDDHTWAIRYLVIDTSNWLGGRRVLFAPAWVTKVSWPDSKVYVTADRSGVENSPQYRGVEHITPAYERQLGEHYRAPESIEAGRSGR
jgi:hypothetical protein